MGLLAMAGCGSTRDLVALDCSDYSDCIGQAQAAQGDGDGLRTRRYLELACERDPAGCNDLGDHLEAALPGAEGAELAYKRACSGGNAEGCARLGRLYASGQGGRAADAARASQSLVRACQLEAAYCDEAERQQPGSTAAPTACEDAADCLGLAWQQWDAGDLPGAASTFELACDLGEASGCEEAGYVLVGLGTGFEVDHGVSLLQRACAMGRPGACQALMAGAENP